MGGELREGFAGVCEQCGGPAGAARGSLHFAQLWCREEVSRRASGSHSEAWSRPAAPGLGSSGPLCSSEPGLLSLKG